MPADVSKTALSKSGTAAHIWLVCSVPGGHVMVWCCIMLLSTGVPLLYKALQQVATSHITSPARQAEQTSQWPGWSVQSTSTPAATLPSLLAANLIQLGRLTASCAHSPLYQLTTAQQYMVLGLQIEPVSVNLLHQVEYGARFIYPEGTCLIIRLWHVCRWQMHVTPSLMGNIRTSNAPPASCPTAALSSLLVRYILAAHPHMHPPPPPAGARAMWFTGRNSGKGFFPGTILAPAVLVQLPTPGSARGCLCTASGCALQNGNTFCYS